MAAQRRFFQQISERLNRNRRNQIEVIMKNTISKLVPLFVLSLGISGVVWAHHGSRISYDLTKQITVKGVIKEVVYQNPHVYFTFDVKDDQGNVTEWAAET